MAGNSKKSSSGNSSGTKKRPAKGASQAAAKTAAKTTVPDTSSPEALEKLARKVRPKVHVHALPRCKGEQHDPSCEDKGVMVSCNQVTVLGVRVCVCTHINI